MNYKNDLLKLNECAIKKNEKIIKLLPYKTLSGFLDNRVKSEIEGSLSRNNTERSLEELRVGVGWKKAKEITKKEITISNDSIRNIPVRRYKREDLVGRKPVILFIHGGGFFSGSLNNVELPCKTIVDKCDVQVISIDYRLSPENKYPSAIIDCGIVLDEVYQNNELYNVDPNEIYIMGDSAGGNLAIVTTIIDKLFSCNHIAGQILVYPALSLAKKESIVDWEKYQDNENTGLLEPYFKKINNSTENIYNWYAGSYCLENKFISPLNTDSSFKFPRTLLICGEYDFLKFQCDSFFEKFKKTTDITYIEYCGMTHAFMDKIGDFPQAESLCQDVANFIERR